MMIWRRTKYSTRLLGLHACLHNNNNPSPEQQTGKLKKHTSISQNVAVEGQTNISEGNEQKARK